MSIAKKFWIGIALLVILSPLGLVLPEHFKAGAAWGEWGVEEMQQLVGYIPQGLAKLASVWHAPIPDYAFKGWEERGLPSLSVAYILSAIVGIGISALVVFVLGRLLQRKNT